jgi:hypothetical protein
VVGRVLGKSGYGGSWTKSEIKLKWLDAFPNFLLEDLLYEVGYISPKFQTKI